MTPTEDQPQFLVDPVCANVPLCCFLQRLCTFFFFFFSLSLSLCLYVCVCVHVLHLNVCLSMRVHTHLTFFCACCWASLYTLRLGRDRDRETCQ